MGIIVAGWGNYADSARVAKVTSMIPELHAIEVNKNGQPSHPLYVPSEAPIVPWKLSPQEADAACLAPYSNNDLDAVSARLHRVFCQIRRGPLDLTHEAAESCS